ncbi:GntR family transcriptional regulator [Breoghania sp.]|uniref:GntR family transcriptional regulator n=1 Tax=Breoghania sp. TaxID=2065378 RepID=UPI002AAC17C7|nr:GntR family transcriptional regulator [Breoghania sp.]
MSIRSASENELGIPLHHHVYIVLRQQILERHYPPGEVMPSEMELSALFGVSRITVRRALDRLQSEKFVSRARGRGTFALPVVPPAPIKANLRGIFENLVAMGLQTTVRLVEFAHVPASPEVALALACAPGDDVQRAVRIRSHEDVPFSHLTTYLPPAVGRLFNEADLAEQPLLTLLEKGGVKVAGAEQSISAKLADPIVARLLDTEPGAALVWVKRLVRDDAGVPVEFLQALYRPEIYEYHIKMARIEGDNASIWRPQEVSGTWPA